MRMGVMIGLAGLALPMPALAQNAAVEAPIAAFANSFNKGDIPGARATHETLVTITDEVAPYHWAGPGAFDAWLAALGADSAAKGVTDESVTIGKATRTLVSGAQAYVIVPAVYRFKQKGVAMSETAQFTFVLHQEGTRWKIRGWTWTGPDATPVK